MTLAELLRRCLRELGERAGRPLGDERPVVWVCALDIRHTDEPIYHLATEKERGSIRCLRCGVALQEKDATPILAPHGFRS